MIAGRHHEEPTAASVIVLGDSVTVEHIEIIDADIASFVGERDPDARPALTEHALRVGFIALRNAGVTLNVDFVEKEFERLLRRTNEAHDRAAAALETSLREAFADGEGRLPRTLERFLGDKGTLRKVIGDLFDEDRRDSALGKMRTMLAGYFDGDGAIVSRMLDPRREDSPLHGFRTEVREAFKDVGDRLLRLEAAREAKAEERARGSAKGADFERVLEYRLAPVARGCGDVVESTGAIVGDTLRGKSGDFVLTLNPSATGGQTVRVAIEAKSGPVGITKISRDLDEARRNRGAVVGLAVFSTNCAPTGCAPLTLHGEHVICEIDADDPDNCVLETAVRLARALAIAITRARDGRVNVLAVHRFLETARNHLKAIQAIKSKLTSVATATREVASALDTLREGVLDCLAGIEDEIVHEAIADSVA